MRIEPIKIPFVDHGRGVFQWAEFDRTPLRMLWQGRYWLLHSPRGSTYYRLDKNNTQMVFDFMPDDTQMTLGMDLSRRPS